MSNDRFTKAPYNPKEEISTPDTSGSGASETPANGILGNNMEKGKDQKNSI